ncbi:uncharacterized protein LOC124258406 isoform X2 [Haliotis rubra]|uniref:uncharacterized protein LOC124258406 isoform X2 n=1 Tax=Haliotis rubra TaxID=36100 RepID=UPI001EE5BB41|nr:uncharacterized protein LOC124258406 isoform X2 [Haliotis rubra]
MPQDSLDHEEVVKGPPESGVDITEQLRQLDLAREDDTADIQLQSDIDRSATDLQRLVIREEALPRGKRDEVDGLIPRMMRHGGVMQTDGQVPMPPPPPYPGHPYQRPSPQQRSSPPQSQQQRRQHHQRQQPVRAGQQYIPAPQVVSQDNFHLYGVTGSGSAQNIHPEGHVMNLGTPEPRQTLPPPYPGGVPSGTPRRLDGSQIGMELSETEMVKLDDIISILKNDLETDGDGSIPRMSIPSMESTADNCGSILKNGQSDWLQTTSHPSSGSSPAQVVPNTDDITSQMLLPNSTSSEDHIMDFLLCGSRSGSLQYPHCSDGQLNKHTVIQNNSPAYPPTVTYPSSNSPCLTFFEDISAPKPEFSRTDTPDFKQQNTGSSQSRLLFQPGKDRDSVLGHGTRVKNAGSSHQQFGFLPDQNGACHGEAPVCHSKQERFSPNQNKTLCGQVPVFRPPPEALVFQPPTERVSPDQNKVLFGGAPVFQGPPERFSPDQHQAPCRGAPVFQGPPESLSGLQNNPPCGQDPVFPSCPDKLSPGQDGRCTNPGEAPGGSPCSSASSHHSPHGPSPSCSTEYSDEDDEDISHDEDTVVHYFADLGFDQVQEIYRDNKQLVENNVNNLNHQRQTALYIAVMLRKYEIMDFLLEIGADPNIQCVERKSDTMQAPLHKAIELGDTQMVWRLLSDEGQDIDLQRVCDKKTPLMLARSMDTYRATGSEIDVKLFISCWATVHVLIDLMRAVTKQSS